LVWVKIWFFDVDQTCRFMVYYGLLQHKNCRTKLSILTQHNCMAWFVCPISQQLGPRPAVWSLLLLGIDHTVGSLVQS
jgi:hypothetical protein